MCTALVGILFYPIATSLFRMFTQVAPVTGKSVADVHTVECRLDSCNEDIFVYKALERQDVIKSINEQQNATFVSLNYLSNPPSK